MPQQEVHIRETINAPVEKVFGFFADHEKFSHLFGSPCKRIKDGAGDVNGLGSVRRLGGNGPLSFDETIVLFEPGRRIDYEVTRGSPIKNHRGTIKFTAAGNRTELDYVVRFDPKIPGTGGLIAGLLGRMWKTNAPKILSRLASA